MKVLRALSFILILSSDCTLAANILFFIGPYSTYSHRVGLEPLANKLADNGHNVTFFGPHEPVVKHKKLINFCPPEVKFLHGRFEALFGVDGLESRVKSKYNVDSGKGNHVFDVAIRYCEVMLKSPIFQDWVKTSTYDLVVYDKSSFPECAFPLSYIWNSKVMGYYGPAIVFPYDIYTFGVPTESSWIPFFTSVYQTQEMTFYNRLHSEIMYLAFHYSFLSYFFPKVETLARTYLDVDGMPPLVNLIASEQILLMNFHYSDHFSRSLPPYMVPVGGMHLTEAKGELSGDLETFIDSAKDGFIYISFGSVIKISSIPESLLTAFFGALRDLQLKFIWKWAGEKPKGIPENVLLLPWLPQKLLLAHPKIRGFIMQGGQMSMQEAIYNGVPVIMFPVNGDQDYNAKRLRRMGNGIEMELNGLTSEIMKEAISRLLNNERYSRMAKLLSKASRDRPLSALETAVWWTEYVLVHDKNATDILKPFCRHQPWWMKKSLDVWGFVFLVILIAMALIVKLALVLVSLFVPKSRKEKRKIS